MNLKYVQATGCPSVRVREKTVVGYSYADVDFNVFNDVLVELESIVI